MGIEKLKAMRKEMEDERIREEIALNERIKNDITKKGNEAKKLEKKIAENIRTRN